MNTPGRRQEVVITGISMSVRSMTLFLAKMAVAAIPAVCIVLITVIPIVTVIRRWVASDRIESVSKRAAAKITSASVALRRSGPSKRMVSTQMNPWVNVETDDEKIELARNLYLVAFGNCADSARKLFGIGKDRRVTNVGGGTFEIWEKAIMRGVGNKWYGSPIKFSCDVTRYGHAVTITDVRRLP